MLHVDVKKLGNIPDGGGWRYVGGRATREEPPGGVELLPLQDSPQPVGLDAVTSMSAARRVPPYPAMGFGPQFVEQEPSARGVDARPAASAALGHGCSSVMTTAAVVVDPAAVDLFLRNLSADSRCVIGAMESSTMRFEMK